jgi:hypothetical protein
MYTSSNIRRYVGTIKINEEGRPINPTEGISLFAGMEGKGGIVINSCSLPCQ